MIEANWRAYNRKGEFMKTYHLKIDQNKECRKCHEKGVTPSGFCLDCITKMFKERTIGFVTIQQAKAELCALVDQYADEMDKAYVKASGELKVALGLTLVGTKMAGEVKLTASINFVESRIKDSTEVLVHEKQLGLPGV